MKSIVFSIVIIVLFTSIVTAAMYPPHLKWNVMKSQHFSLIFHQGEDYAAKELLFYAEEAYQNISDFWQHEMPGGTIYLLLVDNVDYSNAMAAYFPYNAITIYLQAPSGEGFIGNNENWLKTVIYHELMHIVHLNHGTGIYPPLRKLFGRHPVLFPNVFQPGWSIEGLATYAETKWTTKGRGRATDVEMLFRTAALQKQLPRIDQTTGPLIKWPDGNASYLYGYSFLQFLSTQYEEYKLFALNKDYSDTIIPFTIFRPVKRIYGKNLGALWQEWQKELEEKYSTFKNGDASPEILIDRGEYIFQPLFIPEEASIFYSINDPHTFPKLCKFNLNKKKETCFLNKYQGNYLSRYQDEIIFSRLDAYKSFSIYSDLYKYSMTTNKVTRLTYGLRAKDPDFANEDIIFVLNESYNSSIHSLPRNKIPCKEKHCHSRIIIQGEQGTQYSGPKWNEKKKLIAAAKWKINGIMSIIIFTKEGDIIDEIGGDTSRFLSPIWSSDGEYVLFSSDMDGIFNIYSYSLQNKKICKLTSEISGAFYPALLETELAYVRYAAHGYQIASIPLTKNIATCNTPIEMNTPGKITNVNTQKNTYPVSNYSAFSFLIPRYWTPIVFTKEKDIQLGIFTSSKDLLYHSYTLSLSYGYHSNKFMYEFHYNYDRFYPTLGISIKKDLNWYADNDYYSTKEVDLFAYFPFRHLTYQTYASMGISRENHYNHLPYSEKNFSFTWFSIVTGFNNAKKYPYSISPTDGRTIQVQFENALNKNEINGSLYKVQINWNEYIPFIFGHHVIAIKTAYGKSWGNSDFRLVYFMGGFDSDADLLPLRGYKKNVFAASEAAMSNLEYHAPLFNFERGKGNIPVFLQKLHISFFMDFAKARSFQNIWFTKKSYGIEASLDMTLAYELNASISAGYAKGIDAGGINQFYLYFSSDF